MNNQEILDVVLIGGGIASVTLATYLQELEPNWHIHLYEQLDGIAKESTEAWNNAGTGHAGYSELNYTPEDKNGKIQTAKAVEIIEQFEIAKQFWASQVKNKRLNDPKSFICPVNHMVFVWGEKDVDFLKRRHQALSQEALFSEMIYSEDPEQIKQWAPLIMDGRNTHEKVASTFTASGTDVNFGEMTKQLSEALHQNKNYQSFLKHKIIALKQQENKIWALTIKNLENNQMKTVYSKFVFIGAGGEAIHLLQKSGIPESKNYAGFPVGGQFLVIKNPELTAKHQAKVYGKAQAGSPPMSVPHLDLRKINGQSFILFGPFALFNTRFLKSGSIWDLFKTIRPHNILSMLKVGWDNLDLIKYLIQQALLNDKARQKEIQKFFPNIKREDWELITAGQRVQIIKKTPEGAKLQFGTEVVGSADHSLVALIGASPGASVSPAVMLSVLKNHFPDVYQSHSWADKLTAIIPSYGQKLSASAELRQQVKAYTDEWLELK